MSVLASNDVTFELVLYSVVKNIKTESKHIGSLDHNSILRDTNEGVRRFSWEIAWLELNKNVLTLIKFLISYFQKLGSLYFAFLYL